MKKFLIVLAVVVTLLAVSSKTSYAQGDDREDFEAERETEDVHIVKPPANIALSVSPKPFWNDDTNRRNEFLSKTPEERRVMKRQVKIYKKTMSPTAIITPDLSITPSLTVTPHAPKVSFIPELQSLWNGFWGMFRKPPQNTGAMQ
jgi:hypothetical protein